MSWWNRKPKPADPPLADPPYLKDWRMVCCPVCDSQYMYMPNDPNNQSCPGCDRRKK